MSSNKIFLQLILNGNNVNWATVVDLVKNMPKLEELHLSTNNLSDPGNIALEVGNLKNLFVISLFDLFSTIPCGSSICHATQYMIFAQCQ